MYSWRSSRTRQRVALVRKKKNPPWSDAGTDLPRPRPPPFLVVRTALLVHARPGKQSAGWRYLLLYGVNKGLLHIIPYRLHISYLQLVLRERAAGGWVLGQTKHTHHRINIAVTSRPSTFALPLPPSTRSQKYGRDRDIDRSVTDVDVFHVLLPAPRGLDSRSRNRL